MKTIKTIVTNLLIGTLIGTTIWQVAAQEINWDQLQQDFIKATTFNFGDDPTPLNRIEQVCIKAALEPKLRAELELQLIHLIQNAKTYEAIDFACRQLYIIGTVRCLPYLEPLLYQPQTAHIARYTVAAIGGKEAVALLIKAANNLEGHLKAGILESIGRLSLIEATDLLINSLRSDDHAVVEAAACSLGKIGTRIAAEALLQLLEDLQSKIDKTVVEYALLQCGEILIGNGDLIEADKIYSTLINRSSREQVVFAATRGKLLLHGADVMEKILEIIKFKKSPSDSLLIPLIREGTDNQITQLLVRELPTLNIELQTQIIPLLAERGDPSVTDTIFQLLRTTKSEPLIASCIDTIISLQGSAAILPICRVAPNFPERIQWFTLSKLSQIMDNHTEQSIIKEFYNEPAPIQTFMLRLLTLGRSPQAFSLATNIISNPNPALRLQAYRSLAIIDPTSAIKILIPLLNVVATEPELHALSEAIQIAIKKSPSEFKAQTATLLVRALETASEAQAAIIFMLTPYVPTQETLLALTWGLTQKTWRKYAVEALSNWPNEEAIPILLALAQTTQSQQEKQLAFRTIARLVSKTHEPMLYIKRAFLIANTDMDLKILLSGLGGLSSIEALELAEGLLNRSDIVDEAAVAVVQIANQVRLTFPQRAQVAIERALSSSKNDVVITKAKDVLAQIQKYKGYILKWMVAGPFVPDKVEGNAFISAFNQAFSPEKQNQVEWKPLKNGINDWHIDLVAAIGSYEYCAAYLKCRIFSNKTQTLKMEIGSDDAIKVWLNEQLIHSNLVERAIQPAQDIIEVTLKEGWNVLMVKVVNKEGGWAFGTRFVDNHGLPVEDLKIEP